MATGNNGNDDHEHGLPPPDEPFRETLHEAWYGLLGDTLAEQQHLWGKERRAITAEAETVVATLRAQIAELSTKFERTIAEKLATVRDGAPGAQGPRGEPGPEGPPGCNGCDGVFPVVREWASGVHYRGTVATHFGSTWQCIRDTAAEPGSGSDWVCLARSGRSPRICGTYSSDREYRVLDIVAHNGISFIARQDDPGACPDGGGWQALVLRGRKGEQGEKGEKGDRVERGPPGPPAPTIIGWEVNREAYTARPIMSDGSAGAVLELRGLFEQYNQR